MGFLLTDQVEADKVKSEALALNPHHPPPARGDLHPYKGTGRAAGEAPSPVQGQVTNAAWHNDVNLPAQGGPCSPGCTQETSQNDTIPSQRSTAQ